MMHRASQEPLPSHAAPQFEIYSSMAREDDAQELSRFSGDRIQEMRTLEENNKMREEVLREEVFIASPQHN